MITGGDVCKAIASGADAVMIGSPFAKAKEAPEEEAPQTIDDVVEQAKDEEK